MSAPPYMKLWVADYLADTQHLSREEHGAYMLLLMSMWRAGGRLPVADSNLARITKSTAAEWAVIRPAMMPFFKVVRGHLTHKRVTQEIAKFESISCKRSAAAKRGVSKSANKSSELAPAFAEHLHSNSTHNQSQSQSQKEKSSDTDVSGADAPRDLDKHAWAEAIRLLGGQGGMPPAKARAFFGKLLSSNAIVAKDMLPALAAAELASTLDPQGYLTRAAQGVGKRKGPAIRVQGNADWC